MSNSPTVPPPSNLWGKDAAPALPTLWIGYALAVALLVIEDFDPTLNLAFRLDAVGLRPLYLFPCLAWVYWLYCVYKFHDVMAQIPGYNHPITPWRAVGMHFIPIYNLYWVFKWPSEIATFVNWRKQEPAMKGWVAGVLVLAAVLVFRFFDPFMGIILVFSAGEYISYELRGAFLAPPVPASAMARLGGPAAPGL